MDIPTGLNTSDEYRMMLAVGKHTLHIQSEPFRIEGAKTGSNSEAEESQMWLDERVQLVLDD